MFLWLIFLGLGYIDYLNQRTPNSQLGGHRVPLIDALSIPTLEEGGEFREEVKHRQFYQFLFDKILKKKGRLLVIILQKILLHHHIQHQSEAIDDEKPFASQWGVVLQK